MLFLILIHAALGGALVYTRGLNDADRSRAVGGAGVVGAVSALSLFLLRGSGATWGTFTMQEGRGAAAAAAVFCAWLLVVATDDGRGRWEIGALVGAGSAALISFSLSEWVAPALLFWLCLSAATAVASRTVTATGSSRALLGLSDVCIVGALAGWAVEQESWRMPDAVEGWSFYVGVLALALRTGLVPRVGLWDLAQGATVAFIPLLIGSGFALAPSLSGGDEVAVALPFLLAGMLAALWCAIRSPQVVLVASWLVATMIALVFVEPEGLGKAAAAAALAATAALVWPWTGGRAGPERGLLLSLVPLTVGFGPIVGGAIASFERSSSIDAVVTAAPWTAFAALLPAALAVGVTMGAAIARRVEPETYRPVAVLATWAITGLALVLGLTGGAELDLDLSAELWLYVAAAAVAATAARFAPRQPVRSDLEASGPALGVFVLPRSVSQIGGKAGVVLTAVASVAVVGFTYIGLKTGFL